jgi:uncharacterized Zn-finger protein
MDLQSLSLQAPPPIPTTEDMMITPTPPPISLQQPREPYSGIPCLNEEKPPSWMIPNDRPSMLNNTLPNTNTNNTNNRRKPSFAGHGRSVSEFTLPPLSTPSNSSLTPPSTTTNTNTNIRRHTSTHRRAVSANTIDFMLSHTPPPVGITNNNVDIRAQSYSPKESNLISMTPTTSNNFFEQLDVASTADTSGRYVCPYCHKKFSRPSSLRIHTYSHTGEKPFVCTEPGCGRHFSVQSNMRRHLRVHRLGRGSSSGSNGLGTTNEE